MSDYDPGLGMRASLCSLRPSAVPPDAFAVAGRANFTEDVTREGVEHLIPDHMKMYLRTAPAPRDVNGATHEDMKRRQEELLKQVETTNPEAARQIRATGDMHSALQAFADHRLKTVVRTMTTKLVRLEELRLQHGHASHGLDSEFRGYATLPHTRVWLTLCVCAYVCARMCLMSAEARKKIIVRRMTAERAKLRQLIAQYNNVRTFAGPTMRQRYTHIKDSKNDTIDSLSLSSQFRDEHAERYPLLLRAYRVRRHREELRFKVRGALPTGHARNAVAVAPRSILRIAQCHGRARRACHVQGRPLHAQGSHARRCCESRSATARCARPAHQVLPACWLARQRSNVQWHSCPCTRSSSQVVPPHRRLREAHSDRGGPYAYTTRTASRGRSLPAAHSLRLRACCVAQVAPCIPRI